MFEKEKKEKQEKQEKQVFRISPQENKAYETAPYTRKIGKYPNEKYYTTNPLTYIGIMIKHVTFGHGDASYGYALFSKNGIEEKVEYTYEGTTCFREVPVQPCVVPNLTFLCGLVVKKFYDIDEINEYLLLSLN